MGTLQSWRRAYGALKDQTKLGLARVNSDCKDLDVAIVKATNHVECPPKERHVRKILVATSSFRPRADVAYCIDALSKRLAKTRNWTVAIKTLIVFHRLLREGDPTFWEDLLNFQQTGHALQMSNFKDDSSPMAWNCSAWVRTYALFLEERLECFRMLKYDIEAEHLPRPAQGQDKGYSRIRNLNVKDLLEQLPALQQLLRRLMGCRPEGAAVGNSVIQHSLALVLKESFKIYCVINDGIINLVDKFFEMTRHEAIKSLDIYKRAGQQAISLSDYYEMCKGVALARNFQFPVLREPPRSFVVTMEEYIREAPVMVSASVALEYPERLMLTYKQEDAPLPALRSEEMIALEEEPKPSTSSEVVMTSKAVPRPPPIHMDTYDLLGLNTTTQDASAIEECNALPLAIVPSASMPPDSSVSQPKDFDTTGWELALVSTPGTNSSLIQERQLAGGLDSLTLISLYDEGAHRASQQPQYRAPAPNPFAVDYPSASSTHVLTPTAKAQPARNPFTSFPPTYPMLLQQQQQHFLMRPQNWYGETGFGAYPAATQAQTTTNPFGSTSLV